MTRITVHSRLSLMRYIVTLPITSHVNQGDIRFSIWYIRLDESTSNW
jgi:hypothetical protein